MPRQQKKYHYIYKTTNLVNGKYYIGMHSTHNFEDGYVGSGKRLWYSIKKYGKENFKCEILEILPDRSSLKEREKELVNEVLLKNPMCMNIKPGGSGGFSREQQIKNALKSNERQKWLMKNDKEWSEKRLKDRKENGSNVFKKLWEEGRITAHNWKGRKHTPETKEKMKLLKKDFGIGINNSQYGTKWAWVSKNSEVKKIKLELLNDFIDNGWVRGIKK